MTVQEGTGGKGTRIINSNYPVTEGLELGTTKISGRNPNLVANKSIAREIDGVGLDG